MRVPALISWPGTLPSGKLVHEPLHVMDVMPTCLKVAGTSYPSEFVGNKLDPLDGVEFLPLVDGGKQNPSRVLYWEHEGNRAVRRGDWKLVALHKKPWELYDLTVTPLK